MEWTHRITEKRVWHYYASDTGMITGVVAESDRGDHFTAEWWQDGNPKMEVMLFLWEKAAKNWVEDKYEEHIRKENTDADVDKS